MTKEDKQSRRLNAILQAVAITFENLTLNELIVTAAEDLSEKEAVDFNTTVTVCLIRNVKAALEMLEEKENGAKD